MGSNPCPLWVVQSLLSGADCERTITWMLLPRFELTNHHREMFLEWVNGHNVVNYPPHTSKDRHLIWQTRKKPLQVGVHGFLEDAGKQKHFLKKASCVVTVRHTLILLLNIQPYTLVQGWGREMYLGWAAQAGWTLRKEVRKNWKLPFLRCKKTVESYIQSRWRQPPSQIQRGRK